jgi:hypothetical protein
MAPDGPAIFPTGVLPAFDGQVGLVVRQLDLLQGGDLETICCVFLINSFFQRLPELGSEPGFFRFRFIFSSLFQTRPSMGLSVSVVFLIVGLVAVGLLSLWPIKVKV